MGVAISIVMIAVGAIMYWAVNESPDGFDVSTAGMVLMVVGVISLILSYVGWDNPWRRQR